MGFTSIWHWVIVLIVVLVLFGGKGKLSALMGDFGKGLKNFKDQIKSKNDKIEDKPLKQANKPRSTKAKKSLFKFNFKKNDIILLGRESKGVPENIHRKLKNKLKIPISYKTRSLNVAAAASISAAEALRQIKIF